MTKGLFRAIEIKRKRTGVKCNRTQLLQEPCDFEPESLSRKVRILTISRFKRRVGLDESWN